MSCCKYCSKEINNKGYETDQSKAKQLFNPDIILIDKESIKPYLDYTINKYTKDFITLYEKV